MPKSNKKIGGVGIRTPYTADSALTFFTTNCRCRILSNNSISCLNLILTLNPGIVSPYFHVRRNILGDDITDILVKLFPVNNNVGAPKWLDVPGRPVHAGIEIATTTSILNEVNIQRRIFRKTFLNPNTLFDPMCPNVMFMKQFIFNEPHTRNIIIPRPNRTVDQEITEMKSSLGINNNIVPHIAGVYMEFMKGYNNFYDVVPQLPSVRRNFLTSLARFQLDMLHQLGYVHGDFHQGNVMVNPDYNYLGVGGNYLGSVLIIDFGRTRKMTTTELNLSIDKQFQLDLRAQNWAMYINCNYLNFIQARNQGNTIQQIVTTKFLGKNGVPATWPEFVTFIQNRMTHMPGGAKKLKIKNKRKTGKRIKGGIDIDKMIDPNPYNDDMNEKNPFVGNEKVSDEALFKEFFNDKSFAEITDMLTAHFEFMKELDLELDKMSIGSDKSMTTNKDTIDSKSRSKTQKRESLIA